MHPRLLRLVAKRLAAIEKIAAAVSAGFEFVDDERLVVRRMDVVTIVSKAYGIPVSAKLHRSVSAAAKTLGIEAIKNGNRSLFRRVKPRGETLAAAVKRSGELRDLCQGRDASSED